VSVLVVSHFSGSCINSCTPTVSFAFTFMIILLFLFSLYQ
jgi:hypothetical protein